MCIRDRTLTAQPTAPCTNAATSTVTVTVNPQPSCAITFDSGAAKGTVEASSVHTASVPTATLPATYAWVISDGSNNLITSTPPYGNTVTWQAPDATATNSVAVTVTDGNGCVCSTDPPLRVQSINAIPTLSLAGLVLFALLIALVVLRFVR